MFIATDIATNWWMFLVVFGVLSICCLCTCITERWRKEENFVQNSILLVLLRIIFHQASFYILYAFIVFAIDSISSEYFQYTQLFSSHECGFTTLRGGMGTLAFFLAIVAVTPAILATTQYHASTLMLVDYAFSVVFIHFIIVSIVMLDFPASGAWWTAWGAGFVMLSLTTGFITYQFSLMPYKSRMAGDNRKRSKAVVKVQTTGDPAMNIKKVEVNFTGASTSTVGEELTDTNLEDEKTIHDTSTSSLPVPKSSGNPTILLDFPAEEAVSQTAPDTARDRKSKLLTKSSSGYVANDWQQ